MYPFLQMELLKSLLGRSVFHYSQYLNNHLGLRGGYRISKKLVKISK